MLCNTISGGKKVAAGIVCLAASSLGFAQPIIGQIDDFQDATTMNWGGGASPVNVPNSGPNGVGDNCLQFTGIGGAGGGSVPSTHNELQWTGNFQTNDVNVVKVQYRNYSSTDLNMRVVLFGLVGSRWTSTEAFPLPANSGWRTHYHVLTQGEMTRTLGSESFASVYTLVTKMMIRNDSSTPSSGGSPAAATVGIDNVTARNDIALAATDLAVAAGIPFGGTVAETAEPDDNYFFLLNDENEPNGTLEFTFTEQEDMIPTVAWRGLGINLETGATREDLSLFLDYYNFNTNAYTNIHLASSTLSDNVFASTLANNFTQYISEAGGTLKLKARIRWIPQTDLEVSDGWAERVDRLTWFLVP